MIEKQVAIYARVSSDAQAEGGTIESQVASLRRRIDEDQLRLRKDMVFTDAGYSGSTLLRPGLERLRDAAAGGMLDRLYVHSPDRLARKYAYQVLLLDEFTRTGTQVIFLNRQIGQSPEDELLIQVQGMIAEYERAKILERSRRGKRHAAQRGSVSVLSVAPYGYRYVAKQQGGGAARIEITMDEARVVRQIFSWVGQERMTLTAVCRRLQQAGEPTRTGKNRWNTSTVLGMLRNPAYRGAAAYGKRRNGAAPTRLRPPRGCPAQPRRSRSQCACSPDEWILIPVPAIVEEDLFLAVQEQLVENQKRARQRAAGARNLLQGLVTCKECGYALYAKISKHGREPGRQYGYYRCSGSDRARLGGQAICGNSPVRSDLLEAAVWSEVRQLMEEPGRLQEEFSRRLTALTPPEKQERDILDRQIAGLRRGIVRLIDSYAEGILEKDQFNPRIRGMQERVARLEEQARKLSNDASRHHTLELVVGRIEQFSAKVKAGLEHADWETRREIIRALVKQIEVDRSQATVVFRVDPAPFVLGPDRGPWQHRLRRDDESIRRRVSSRRSNEADRPASPVQMAEANS